MKQRLLKYLICPSCGGEIELSQVAQTDHDEIIEGELSCSACLLRVPVSRGIPRFAKLEQVETEKAATAKQFGWQWQHFTQSDERYGDQFLGWIAPVQPDCFRDKGVVEGRCGK